MSLIEQLADRIQSGGAPQQERFDLPERMADSIVEFESKPAPDVRSAFSKLTEADFAAAEKALGSGIGFLEAAGAQGIVGYTPYGSTMQEGDQLVEMLGAHARRREGLDTREDQLVLLNALVEEKRGTTAGGFGGVLLRESLPFIFETGIAIGTGGAAGGALGGKVATKAALKTAQRQALAETLQVTGRAVGTLGTAAAANQLVPHALGKLGGWDVADLSRRYPEHLAELDANPELRESLAIAENAAAIEIARRMSDEGRGLKEVAIMFGTELAGGPIGKVLGHMPVTATLMAGQRAVFRKLAGGTAGETLQRLTNRTGIHSGLAEVSEEWVARALNVAAGLGTWEDELPTMRDGVLEALFLMVPGMSVAVGQRLFQGLGAQGEQAGAATPEGGDPVSVAPEPDRPAGEGAATSSEAAADVTDIGAGDPFEGRDPFEGAGLPADPAVPLNEQSLGERLQRRSAAERRERPMTALDHVLALGGFDLRSSGETNEGADVVQRMLQGLANRQGLPAGLVKREGSNAQEAGLAPDDMAEALAERGFAFESTDEVLEALEAELGGGAPVFLDDELNALEAQRQEWNAWAAQNLEADEFDIDRVAEREGFTGEAAEVSEEEMAEVPFSPLLGSPRGVPSSRPLPKPRSAAAGGIRGALSKAPTGLASLSQGSIGRNLVGTTDATTERRTNLPRIMDALSQVVAASGGNTPIRSGRVRTKWAAGHFDVHQQTIELLRSNDIAVATHEVAHAIERHILGAKNPWNPGGAAGIDSAARAELERLGKELYGSQKPNGGYRREGWAEYVRLWAIEGGATNTPALDAWMQGTFLPANPSVAQALENVRDLATVWRTQGSVGRGEAMIVREDTLPEKARKARQAVASGQMSADAFDAWIDEFGPYHRLAREAERKGQGLLPADKDPEKIASMLRLTAPARVEYMVKHGMIDVAGNRTGVPGLETIRPLIKNRYEDFTLYLYARRALALLNDPKGPRDPGISKVDAERIVEEVGSPEFEKAARQLYAWQSGVLDYAADASPTLAHTVEKMRKRDPGAYIPLQREFDEISRRARAGSTKGGSLSKKLKGSGRRIKDPLPVILAQAENMVQRAHERMVLESIIRLKAVPGMGHLVEQVPVDKVPAASRTIEELLNELERKTRAGGNRSSSLGRRVIEAELAQAGLDTMERVTFFEQSFQPTKADETPVVPVIEEGKLRYYRIGDPSLYRALEGLDVPRLGKWSDIFFGLPKRLFTLGTTGLSPRFALISNPWRDFHMFRATTSIPNPVEAGLAWTSMAGQLFLEAATLGKRTNEWIDTYRRMGVNMAARFAEDTQRTRKVARRLAGWRVHDLNPVSIAQDTAAVLQEVVQFAEAAPRVAEMKAVATRLGVQAGQKMTLAQSIEIGLAGKRVTTDFTAAGHVARTWNQGIPFFNAAIQGPRAHLRALKTHPLRYVVTGLAFSTAPMAAMWLMYRDEEWYKEMTDEERYAYFYMRAGEGELIRAPRAHEFDFFFATLPEMVLNRWYEADPEGAVGWAEELAAGVVDVAREGTRTMNPLSPPVLIGLGAEQLRNRTYFWDSPIVSRSLEKMPAEEQFDDYTSKAAIAIGDALGLSPKRVEHAIGYLTGTVGREILQATGRGVDEIEIERELADVPVLGALFRRGGTDSMRSRSVEEVYELYDEADRRGASNRVTETQEMKTERLLLQDASKALTALSHARQVTSSADARRALARERLAIAQDALKAIENGVTLRERAEIQARAKKAARDRDVAEAAVGRE